MEQRNKGNHDQEGRHVEQRDGECGTYSGYSAFMVAFSDHEGEFTGQPVDDPHPQKNTVCFDEDEGLPDPDVPWLNPPEYQKAGHQSAQLQEQCGGREEGKAPEPVGEQSDH